MKVKLKSWDEVVKLAKENGDYDDVAGTVYYLTRRAAPWGEWVYADKDTLSDCFMVDDDECPYYLKSYMIEDE